MTRFQYDMLIACVLLAMPGSTFAGEPPPSKPPAAARGDAFGDPLPLGVRLRLGTTRFRHVGSVYCLAFTPDGKTLASCSWGTRDVRLWEVATARELPPLVGHTNDVGCIAISRDGRTLASSAYFGEVRVLDLTTRKELCSFPAHGNWVALAPDGKTVAFLNSDRLVSVRDVATGKELHRLKWNPEGPRHFAFSPDGTALATADEEGEVRLWNVASGKTVHSWVHRGHVTSVAFAPDGKAVAAGYLNNGVRVWNVATGKEMARVELPNNQVYAICFSPNGKWLAIGSHQVRLWDTAMWKEQARFGDYGNATALAFSPDGKTLACGNDCHSVQLWDVAARTELRPLAGHQGPVRALAFTPGGRALVTGGFDDTVRLWNPATGKELLRIRAHQYGSWSVAVSPDGRLVASAGSSPARVWDAADGKELHVLRGGILAVAFAPDGKTLVTGSDRGGVHFWDSATGRERATGSAPDHHPRSFAFSPDGRLLASSGERDAEVYLWDSASGKQLRRLPAPKDGVKVVAWSPDGRTLAVASDGDYRTDAAVRDIVLFDAQTGRELLRLKEAHTSRVFAVAFSPDGRTLASAGTCARQSPPILDDDTVRLWEVDTGERRLGLGRVQDWVRCLAFSPDGRTLATGAEDSTVLLWDLPDKSRLPEPLDEKQLEALWADLAGADARKAYSALWTLAGAPGQSVALLKKRLRRVAPEDVALAERLLRDLDSNVFTVRAKAEHDMRVLGDVAVPTLEKALAGNPTLEVRRRVQQLLKDLDSPGFSRRRQNLRAVEALEYIGTAAARELLAALASGAPEARLTRAAGASLGRLEGRDDPKQ
jgi:WD40 repeat protein